MRRKIWFFKNEMIDFNRLYEIYQGWQAYARWANTYKLRNKIKKERIEVVWNKISFE